MISQNYGRVVIVENIIIFEACISKCAYVDVYDLGHAVTADRVFIKTEFFPALYTDNIECQMFFTRLHDIVVDGPTLLDTVTTEEKITLYYVHLCSTRVL